MAGLALTSLKLSHFRSHKSGKVIPDGRPLAFFGANGAGKTNILEAVSLLSPGRGIRRAAIEEFSRTPELIGWKVSATLESLGHNHEVTTWAEPGLSRQVEIDDKPAPQLALGRLLRMVWLVPSMDRLWLEGAEGRRRFLDRMTLSFVPDHAEATLAYEKAMRQRNRLLKDRVSNDSWYRALEVRMAETGAEITENRMATLERIKAAQDDTTSAFPIADLTLIDGGENTVEPGKDALLASLLNGRPRDMMAGRTLSGPHRADLGAVFAAKEIEARLCSTGEQKALLISLILANARALSQYFGAAPIILLDEVAAHLDENRRALLYDEIIALGAQAWMTGTDASLFDALGTRAALFEVSDGSDGSVIKERA